MNYEKYLFIGARGEYHKTRFEVLGHGQVDYIPNYTRYLEDRNELGKVFKTHEYYCLANNGQIWYFAIEAEEVYYCRQLSKEEIADLNQPKLILNEKGKGRMKKYKGRALIDFLNYRTFEYYNYSLANKNYSKDIFDNNYEEWFETKFIAKEELPRIFYNTLRIQNPKKANLVKQSKLNLNLLIISCIVLIISLFGYPILNRIATKKITESKITFDLSNPNTEYQILANYETEPNQFYRFRLITEVDKNPSKRINFDSKIVVSENEVTKETIEEKFGLEYKRFTERYNFYTKTKQTHTISIKLSQTEMTDLINPSINQNQTPNNQEKITFKTIVYTGGLDKGIWVFGIFIISLTILATYFLFSNTKEKLKALQYEN